MNTFLDKIGLQRLWGKIKALVPTKVSELENDSGYITDKEKEYLSFVALESGAFGFTHSVDGNVLYYSKNHEAWTELTEPVSVVTGDVVRFKGELTANLTKGIGTFTSEGTFDVFGNIMSLLYGDDFVGKYATKENYQFRRLLMNTKVVSAENLLLPATTLTLGCYGYMFQGCTELLIAPELPAQSLANSAYIVMFGGCTKLEKAPFLPALVSHGAYKSMFQGCASLNYVKVYAGDLYTVDEGSGTATFHSVNWLKDVATSGTIVLKGGQGYSIIRSPNFIPEGWNVMTDETDITTFATKEELAKKQDVLVPGTNIKTINNQSLLGEGNITIEGGSGGDANVIESVKVNGTALTPDSSKAVDIQSIPAGIVSQDGTHRFVSDTEKDTWNNKSDFSGSYNDLSDKPTIPAAVTESTVSGWGFTKNTGTYSKPSGGIPSSDLATAVQNALTAAGTALQPADLNTLNGKVAALESLVSEGDNPTAAIDKFNEIVAFLANITNTDTLNGILNGINEAIAAKYTKPSGGIPKNDLATAVQTSLGKADTALQSFTESDPTVPSHVKSITTTDISNWNSKVSNVQADWNATSGDAAILNKPTIPTKTSQLTNDSNFLTEDDVQRFFTGTQTISENQDIAGAKDGDIYMKTV